MESDPIREKTPVRPKEPEPKPAEKQQPSSFDRMLEQSRLMQQAPVAQQQQHSRQSGEESQREARRESQREPKRETRQERQRETGGAKSDRVLKEKGEEGPQHRIVVKTQLKRDQGGGEQGKGGGAGHGGHGFSKKETAMQRSRAEMKNAPAHVAPNQFQHQLKHRAHVVGEPTTQQMQKLVNQLVQYIRVGRTAVGADELQLGMNEAVFHGLRLRLTAKGGSVTVEFASSHSDVRALFQRERDHIRRQLEAKGVHVAAIQVVDGG